MIRTISKDEQALINTIEGNLPLGSPFITAQVTMALGLAKKYLSNQKRKYDIGDNIYLHSLRVAVDASKYALTISENNFYRYDLVVIALLHDIIEDADCAELRQDLNEFRTIIHPNISHKTTYIHLLPDHLHFGFQYGLLSTTIIFFRLHTAPSMPKLHPSRSRLIF